MPEPQYHAHLTLTLTLALVLLAGTPAPAARIALAPGDPLVLRLALPGPGCHWDLSYDRALLARDRLAAVAAGAEVYRFTAVGPGRTVVRGVCARGMERPVGRVEVEIEIVVMHDDERSPE